MSHKYSQKKPPLQGRKCWFLSSVQRRAHKLFGHLVSWRTTNSPINQRPHHSGDCISTSAICLEDAASHRHTTMRHSLQRREAFMEGDSSFLRGCDSNVRFSVGSVLNHTLGLQNLSVSAPSPLREFISYQSLACTNTKNKTKTCI